MEYAISWWLAGRWHWAGGFCSRAAAELYLLTQTTATVWDYYRRDAGGWRKLV